MLIRWKFADFKLYTLLIDACVTTGTEQYQNVAAKHIAEIDRRYQFVENCNSLEVYQLLESRPHPCTIGLDKHQPNSNGDEMLQISNKFVEYTGNAPQFISFASEHQHVIP